MRQVVTLVGLNAGTVIWMDDIVAQTCIDTGTARWPSAEDFESEESGEEQSEAPVDAKDLALKFESGKLIVVGEWPERLRITSKLASLPQTVKSEGGQIHFAFDRKATYRMIAEERGEIIGVLESGEPAPAEAVEEVVDGEAEIVEEVAEAGVIPADWRDLHWKRRIKLASEILGEPVETVEDAALIIEAAESEIQRATADEA
jgi:hypothetical protein